VKFNDLILIKIESQRTFSLVIEVALACI